MKNHSESRIKIEANMLKAESSKPDVQKIGFEL